jgi:rhamnosyltransferase
MNKIIASIITYNPESDRLEKNINAIATQVDCVVIVDNGSKNIKDIYKIKDKLKFNIELILNEKNIGIAAALNQALNYANKNNFDWILTLDQDSVCADNMIEEMKNYYKKGNNGKIALIAPNILDENISLKNSEIQYGIEYTNAVITSGSLTRTDVAISINGFVEELFIDQVDFDFCLRIKDAGFEIIRVNHAIIYHQLGEISEHKFFGKTITTTNHSYLRRYYYYRNLVYMYKMHKENHKEWIDFEVKHATKNIPRIILFEKNKFKQMRFIIKGISDGVNEKYGEYK